MKTKNLLFTALFSFLLTKSFSQITQTIRGKVIEKETQTEIVGAEVYLTTDSTKKIGTTTDVNGDFRLENVEIGRHSLKISFIGYNDVFLSNIIVDAGKEVILNIEMEEKVNVKDEILVTANTKGESTNDMTSGSTRSFTIEETNRYAGSTRFYDIQQDYLTAQLGYTWYGKEFQRSGLNRHCKLLLLTYVFEEWGLERLEFRAHAGNEKSITAMKDIGCVVEGILRSQMPTVDGSRRDSIVLSILKTEWFAKVRELLLQKTH